MHHIHSYDCRSVSALALTACLITLGGCGSESGAPSDDPIVDQTPDNDPSQYRVCYSSPVPFTDRTGDLARPDPWDDGPSAYFGTTWFTGLLPDCDENDPVAPCVVKWTDDGGNRVATILTPPGDPFIR